MINKVIFIIFLCLANINANAANAANEQELAFLASHWGDSITAGSIDNEPRPSLQPESCGECHQQQYSDWKNTWHSRAMGPGVAGQLLDMVENDPYTAKICWECHVPLAEQQDLFLQDEQWHKNPNFNPSLQQHGITCAACHVRENQHFGPPRKGQFPQMGVVNDEGLPHGGFIAQSAFQKSEFCKGCHQFNEDDYALNGKLIENTYNEWQASEYAQKGVQCQGCHMPDRRHLWRGIHDQEMTQSGITVDVTPPSGKLSSNELLEVNITITNSGTGHHFPTYLTPKIFVRAYLIDSDGNIINESWQQAIIGREATLDLQQELYDTRIPAGGVLPITYQQQLPEKATHLKIEIEVEPDHFYEKFYRAVLADGGGGKGRALLQQALHDAEHSNYFIYQKMFPLNLKLVALEKTATFEPAAPPQ